MEPDWLEHAIWWHFLPLSFVGAESDSAGVEAAHRLGRIVDWFDYVVELGVSGIALGPVFASRTHGYDTTDHFRIDPRLGDDTDFPGAARGSARPGPACAARRGVQPRRSRFSGVRGG